MESRRRALWSPGQLLRQAGSVVLYGLLTRWRYMPRWLVSGFDLLGLVAGGEGMGCIGFPKHPVVEVTSQCNLECLHCHAYCRRGQGQELSFEQMRLLLRELAAQNEFKMVVFSGGEPLIRQDIVELCHYASWLGLWVVVATNGTLLDEAMLARLSRAGVCGVAVGLDGDCPSVHDGIRGVQGAFKRAIEGCIAVRRAGLVLQMNVTLMQQNYERLPQMLRLFESLGASVVLAYFCEACGRGLRNDEILLSADQFAVTLRQMAELQSRSRLIIEPVCAPMYWPMLGQRNRLSSLAVRLLGSLVFHGCVAGTGLFYVTADGEALPCPFLPISAGSVLKEGVSRLWREGRLLELVGDPTRTSEEPGRSKCRFYRMCGGCRARALRGYDDSDAPDPFCFLFEGASSATRASPKESEATTERIA